MAYGFSSINSTGFVQIDENYSNYSLISSGTMNSPAPTYVNYVQTNTPRIYYSDYGMPPLIFIRSLASNRFIRLIRITNTYADLNVYEETWSGLGTRMGYTSPTANTYEYRVYSRQPVSGLDIGYGMNVYTGLSNRASFSSNTKSMRVHAIHSATYIHQNMELGAQNTPISAPVNPWFSINSTSFVPDVGGYDYYEALSYVINISNNNLMVMGRSDGPPPDGDPYWEFYNPNTSFSVPYMNIPVTTITLKS